MNQPTGSSRSTRCTECQIATETGTTSTRYAVRHRRSVRATHSLDVARAMFLRIPRIVMNMRTLSMYRQRLHVTRLLSLTMILTCVVKSACGGPPDQPGPPQTTIELTLVDDRAIGYATYQSHNQKVISNPWGIFITYIHQANSNYTAQQWRLAHSVDGGKSFVTIREETRATSAPVLETQPAGTLFFARPDFQNGNAYLSRLESLDAEPATTTLTGGAAGKYCMVLDTPRNQLYHLAHNGRFHIVGVDGQVRHTEQLLLDGERALLMYPHLALGQDGTLYAAWTTQQRGKYVYRSIRAMKSTDGGVRWQTLEGRPVEPPLLADNGGPATHITHDDELDVHSWLSALMAKDGKLHFVYWAETTPQRQRYVRIDGAAGTREIDIQRIFGGRTMSKPNDSGALVAQRTKPGAPLFFVSTIDDWKRLACWVSEDNGQTWREHAISERAFKHRIYSIGAARDVTADGWIVGTFTDVAKQAKTYYEPGLGSVYAFRIKAQPGDTDPQQK